MKRSKLGLPPSNFNIIPVSLAITCLIFVVSALMLPKIGSLPEVYYDIVVETLAEKNTNRSHELSFFYILLVISSILIFVAWQIPFFRSKEWSKSVDLTFFFLISINTLYLIARGEIYTPLFFALMSYCVFFFLHREHRFLLFFNLIILFYAITGLSSLFYFLQSAPSITIEHLICASIFVMSIIYAIWRKYYPSSISFLRKTLLFSQIFVPLSYISLINSRYLFQGNEIILWYHWKYIAAIILILSATFFFFFRELKSVNSKNTSSAIDYIMKSTIISIYTLRSSIHDSYNLVIQDDSHHTAESVLLFPQVFSFDQELYTEIVPASGLFPLLVGFINQFFNEGSYISAFSTHTLVTTLFCIVTMSLYLVVFGKIPALIIALIFKLTFYNRIYLIMPVALLLAHPKLRNKPDLWLPIWVFSIFCAGLYYPIFGVGLLVSSLGFGLKQWKNFLEMPKSSRSKYYFLVWSLVSIPILFSIPLLFEMLQHTLRYSQQSILADGISVFGESLPAFYFPYIEQPAIRAFLYYGFKFSLPILFIMIALTLFLQHYNEKKSANTPWGLCLSVALFVPLISFSFTLIREDVGMILARASHPIVISCALIVGVLWNKNLEITNKSSSITCIFLISLCGVFFVPVVNLLPTPYKLVPDYYEIYQESHPNFRVNLGTGFAPAPYVEYCEFMDWNYHKLENELPVLSDMGQAVFIVNHWETAATGTTMIAKDVYTQQKLLDILENKEVAFHSVNSLTNYYIYYDFLVNRGYRQGNDLFYLSPTEIDRQYGSDYETADPTIARFCDIDIGNVPASWGQSMTSLGEIFLPVYELNSSEKNLLNMDVSYTESNSITIEFMEELMGYDGDFLYLKLDYENKIQENSSGMYAYLSKNRENEKYKVSIQWTNKGESTYDNENQFICNFGSGELLIPLGANPSWLLDTQSGFEINFSGEFSSEDSIILQDATLLKLIHER